MWFSKIFILILAFVSISCGFSSKQHSKVETTYKYLALGNSYTIGESVCDDCNYPKQLTDSLNATLSNRTSVKIIAKTGWTTSDLLTEIAAENPSKDYDLVTLLIGVNNQYQGQLFSVYKEEFPKLVDKAIRFANGKPENVIVLSIPDYAFTPFGKNSGKELIINAELKSYNAYSEKIASQKGVHFENITPITQQGLENSKLVATDGLHPSEVAYKKFVKQIFPSVKKIIKKN